MIVGYVFLALWSFGLPALLSLTALAMSRERPRGRVGFFPLIITTIGFATWLVDRILSFTP